MEVAANFETYRPPTGKSSNAFVPFARPAGEKWGWHMPDYGTAGTALLSSTLDEGRVQVGRAGELATADVLRKLEATHPEIAVLHSLRVPGMGDVDVDHAVVSGHSVLLIDSKVWKPGVYWTIAGHHFRGMHPAPHAGRKTMPWAARAVQAVLPRHAIVEVPVIVVWPSSSRKPMRLWAWRPAGGVRGMTGQQFARRAKRLVRPRPADPAIVAVLRRMVTE